MKIKPTKLQLDFMDWEFGVFFHFGIRTCYKGPADWGKEMSADAFNPTELDCKQWVRTAKAIGAKYCILTCKHHDGFALWPSKYTEHSVKNAPWEQGKGDVVRDYVRACREYNMRVGIYYSPAQWGGEVKFENAEAYDDYFCAQLSELLTDYGRIDYIWFDGYGSEKHVYDKERVVRTVRELQPEILIYDLWDPDTRWIGNEDGYANMPNINIKDSVAFSVNTREEVSIGGYRYLPAECDARIRATWFNFEANEDTLKSVDELMGIYEYSVGRGANLLLNIAPDKTGLLPKEDVARAKEFGAEIRRRYEYALHFSNVEQNGDHWEIHAEDPTYVDAVIIEEDITEGEAIESFRIICGTPQYRKPICVYMGMNIGHKAICRFPPIKTASVMVEVTAANGEVKLKSVKAYYTKK